MEILLDKKTDSHSSCQVTLEEKDYQVLLDKNLKNYARQATIKGFRQGSTALLSIVKKRYGKEILQDIIFSEANKQLDKAIVKEELLLLSNPTVDEAKLGTINWLKDKTFSVTYQFDIAPSFDLALDKTIEVERFTLEGPTTDDEVATHITSMREDFGTLKRVATIQEKVLLYGNVLFSTEKIAPMDDFQLKLTAAHAEALHALQISKKNDEVMLTPSVLAKLDTFFSKKLVQKIKEAEEVPLFRVIDIFMPEPAPLDTDFFSKVCDKKEVKTLEECKEFLREKLYKQNQRKSDYLLDMDIKQKLISMANISLPASYEKHATQIQWNLIIHYLTKKYNLTVTEKDIINELGNIYIYRTIMSGQEVNQESILEEIKQELKSNEKADYTDAKIRLQEKRLIAFSKEKISIQTKPGNYIQLKSILSSRMS